MQLNDEDRKAQVWTLPVKLFLAGIFLTFIGFIVLIASATLHGNSSISGGLVIFVGPIPIILGAGPFAVFAILLAVILTITGLIMFFVLNRKAFKKPD